MSYEENKISDLIDGGLYEQKLLFEFMDWIYVQCYEQIDIAKWKRWYTDEALKHYENEANPDVELDFKVYTTDEIYKKWKNSHTHACTVEDYQKELRATVEQVFPELRIENHKSIGILEQVKKAYELIENNTARSIFEARDILELILINNKTI